MTQTLDLARATATGTAPDPAPAEGRPLAAKLADVLDGRWAEGRRAARATWPAAGMLRDPALTMAEARAWTLERVRTIVAAGFGRAGSDPAYGGRGGVAQSVLDFETMAHGDLSVTIKSGVQHGLFGGAIVNLGTASHHERFLADTLDLNLLGAFAMTEMGHGSDVMSLETTITYDRRTDEFVIDSPTPSATKTYLGNAAEHGRMAAVFGQLIVHGVRHGVHCVLVPFRDEAGNDLPGVTTGDNGHKGGLLGVDNGTIAFDHVRVPRDLLLDRYGGVGDDGLYHSSIANPNRRFFTMIGTLVRGRICIGAGAAIAARRGLAIATRYALRRRQFVRPGSADEVLLLDYLAHQRKLLPAIAEAYALGFANNELIGRLEQVWDGSSDDPVAHRELETLAAGLKALQTRFANDTLQTCREACGGAGFISANQLTQLRADADVFATFEGDNTVLLQLVAKGVLTNFKEAWNELDRVGVVQASARMVGHAVIERTGAGLLVDRLVQRAQRRREEATLFDRGWHAWMFTERERHVVDGLARRMAAVKRNDFDALNRLQDHVLLAGRVHMDRIVLDAFIAGIAECPDEETREVMERLCTLYALSSIEADAGWFQEHNRLSAGRAKAVRAQINALCAELRPHAEALVDGFGIPADWLGAEFLED